MKRLPIFAFRLSAPKLPQIIRVSGLALPLLASLSLLPSAAVAEPTALVNTAPGATDATADPASGKTPNLNAAPIASKPTAASGGEKSKSIQINSSNSIRLNYGLKDWNTSPTKIDSASMIMREGSSGRVVQIYLEETAPDSSVFSGLYSINWQNLDKMAVEFYVPPQNLLSTNDGMKKVLAMINSRELRRHPFILHRTASGQQTVEIFDTREQAVNAMKAFRAEQQLIAQGNRKYPSDSDVDTSASAADLRAKEAAAHAASDRVRLEQVEAQRLQQMNDEANKRTQAETAARKAQSKESAATGMNFYP